MFFNDNMRRDDVDINITNTNQNVNANMNDNMNYNEMEGYAMPMQPQMGSIMSPIIEPGRERIVNRTFVHEVPHE
ncbi:MAG: hypothetical protein MR598_03030 [Erysipelotrichaceae bacterium]|nr:hypothetical protein [Erysipelotrichaceae bacterium]